mmetsp:Transcript_5518/g.12986  ORF Transcript_5518/g.12986 Transcript_5518/m.12986 type:complete len:83 (-) Transcript_5518:192-440(-)
MRMANTTIQIVEVLHIVVLVIFTIWAPLCFSFQQEVEQLEEPSKLVACETEDRGRWTILPFFVALIGGGVFSLEAFEAFPML